MNDSDGRRRSSNPFISHLARLGLNISTVHFERDDETGNRMLVPLSKNREFLDTAAVYTWVSTFNFPIIGQRADN